MAQVIFILSKSYMAYIVIVNYILLKVKEF